MVENRIAESAKFLYWDCSTPPGARKDIRENMQRTLRALAEKYRRQGFMAGFDSNEQMLEGALDLLLPAQRLVDFLVTKLGEDQLLLRPAVILPSHQTAWPGGLVLALRGRVEPRNKMFRVNGLVSMQHHHVRDFERQIAVISVRGYPPSGENENNVFEASWLSNLPSMGEVTNTRLREWSDYLEWKRRLVDAGVYGARYMSRSLEADGIWTFAVVLAQSPSRTTIERSLRKRALHAFSLDHSEALWQLKWAADTRKGQRWELGDLHSQLVAPDLLPALREAIAELPSAELFHYRYALSDNDKILFETLSEELGVEAACRKMEAQVPEQGFLAINAEGDRSLIKRQLSEVRELRENPGQAPFLTAYLFDISRAKVPDNNLIIADGEWLRGGMNAAQKDAVRMMLNTPEISLIQGPPGSGKTTMIAEAIYQLARRGNKVLLASQANLAVDNALERLSNAPSIRAIRLGKKADQTHPFAESNAATTYWNSVASSCHSTHVEKWEKVDLALTLVGQKVNTLALLAGDLESAVQSSNTARLAVVEVGKQLATSVMMLETAQSVHESHEAALSFLAAVKDSALTWGGTLPSWLCMDLHHQLSNAQAILSSVGVAPGRPLGILDLLSCAAQSQDLYLFACHVDKLAELLPSVLNELQRLQQNTSGRLVTAEQERNIQLLRDQKARLIDRWTGGDPDPDLQKQMSACASELSALERSGGLDREWYAKLFDCDNEVFERSPKLDQVVSRLNSAASAIQSAHETLLRALATAEQQLTAAASGAVCVDEEVRRVAAIELLCRDAEFVLQGEQRHLDAVLARLQKLNPEALIGSSDAQDLCVSLLVSARSELAVLEEKSRETAVVRLEWSPILNEWTQSLIKAPPGVMPGYLNDVFRIQCNVVAVTCNESRKTLNEAGHHAFDVAIIDEVSKATPPELLMAMSMARAIILVGDHRQLPPVFKEGISAQEHLEEMAEQESAAPEEENKAVALTSENMKKYEHLVSASLFKQHFEEAPAALKSFLLVQYRMHPQIMDVVNKFYENRLECGLADPNGKLTTTKKEDCRMHALTLSGPQGLPYLSPEQHVLWVDSGLTPTGERALESQSASGGKSNLTECALIMQMLRDLDNACHAQGYGVAGVGKKDVGVVTFYTGQVSILRTLIRKVAAGTSEFKAIKVDVNTADNYQGKEKPIIFVSLVRNPPHRLSSKANTARFERINVAFSRAQELLVIVGAAEVFRNYPVTLPNLDRPGSAVKRVYGQVIDEISLNGGFLQAEQVIDRNNYDILIAAQGATAAGRGRGNQARVAQRTTSQKRKWA